MANTTIAEDRLWNIAARQRRGGFEQVFEHRTGMQADILETEMPEREIGLAGPMAGTAVENHRLRLVGDAQARGELAVLSRMRSPARTSAAASSAPAA